MPNSGPACRRPHLSHDLLQTVVMTETPILFIFIHTGCDVGSAVFFTAHSINSPPATQVFPSRLRNCRQDHTLTRYGNFIDTGEFMLCSTEVFPSPMAARFFECSGRSKLAFTGPTAVPNCHRLRQGVIGGGVRDCAANLLIRSQAQFAFPFGLAWTRTCSRTCGGRTRRDTVAPCTHGVPTCRCLFWWLHSQDLCSSSWPILILLVFGVSSVFVVS